MKTASGLNTEAEYKEDIKMLEIKVTIEAPAIATALNNLAGAIAGAKAKPTPVQTAPAPVQTAGPAVTAPSNQSAVPLASAPQYTVDQIMTAGATLMDAGRVNDLMNLLHSFGVQAVTDLKVEQYGAFVTELRNLGAKI